MRLTRLLLANVLLLVSCRNPDAYLGGGHEAYQCTLRCDREQGAPEDSGDWFFNPTTTQGDAPLIVYPLAGAVHPKDLSRLTVQFKPGRDDFELFRVRLQAKGGALYYDFFTPCLSVRGDGCRYLLEGAVWDRARADLVGQPSVLTVTGATARVGVQRSSDPVALEIVESSLGNKGFYYWTLLPQYPLDAPPLAGIFRLPFGADRAQPFIMPNTSTNDRQCGACHSVSRDGSTIAFTARDYNDDPDQRSGSLEVKLTARPDRQVVPAAAPGTYDSSMMALSSDGKLVLVAYDKQLSLRSAAPDPLGKHQPGDVLTSLSQEQLSGKIGYFPEFSPTDDAVVLTLSDTPDSAIAVQSGDIAVIDFDAVAMSFGTPKIIVPGSDDIFHFYPTWSPDGKYVAFASAPRELGEDGHPRKSYDQKKARLRLVQREGGKVYELGNATYEESTWSTYPKFAPFSAGQADTLMFLTFNSKMSYGLLLDNDAKPSEQRLAQLWMSAVDVSKLPEDPSSPPVWLPFQDSTQPAHLGIWTNDVKCRTDLGGPSCDMGQRCQASTNTCVVDPK
jgi:hypothetical protein